MTFWIVLLGGYLLTWLLIPHLLLSKRRPVSTLAWLWAIILFPYLGALAYLLGTDHLKRKRVRRRTGFRDEKTRRRAAAAVTPEQQSELSAEDRGLVTALSRLTGIPPSSADDIDLLVDAAAFYPALLQRIEDAKDHVHVQFYQWQKDDIGREFLDALVRCARRGVEVRLLLDEIGSWSTGRRFFRPLVQAGGQFSWCNTMDPWRNRFFLHLRNHRKVQIIDGATAFVGGMNVGLEYQGRHPKLRSWRDIQVELTGPVAAVLQSVFADDWYYASQERLAHAKYYPEEGARGKHLVQVVAGGPDSVPNPMLNSILSILQHARTRVWITAGYFVPDTPVLHALQTCAARGVEVRLLVAEKLDHPLLVEVGRGFYEELLSFGVRIFESHVINHSKVMLIDDRWLMVGSTNLDVRSVRLNFELNVLARSDVHTEALRKTLAEDFKRATEIDPQKFARRPLRQRLAQAALRPLAPIL